jgi:hypothetical protein
VTSVEPLRSRAQANVAELDVGVNVRNTDDPFAGTGIAYDVASVKPMSWWSHRSRTVRLVAGAMPSAEKHAGPHVRTVGEGRLFSPTTA